MATTDRDLTDIRRPAAYQDRIGYLLKVAAHRIRIDMDAALAGHDLTTPQYAVLSALNAPQALSNADLARRSFVTPQTMNELLKSLRARALVARAGDPAHGRRILYRLTPAGERAIAAVDATVRDLDARRLEPFDDAEVEVLRALLRRYSEQSSDEPSAGS